MDFTDCPQGRSGASGFVIAMNFKTGKRRWIYRSGPVESSPLLVGRTLYFGSWDRKVHAVDARTGKRRWTFTGDEEINTSAAFSKGRIFIASDAGTIYALDAKTGKKRWSAKPSSEFFYATPTVAYGRVFIGNTDGTMYAYGARSGRLLWAKPLGSYIYAAAGVAKKRVFTGTYDGFVYSLNAATGDVAWKKPAPARGARLADDHERPGLLLHLRHLRLRGLTRGEERPRQHRRLQHAHRPRALAAQPGEVREPGGGRLEAGVPDGPLVPVRADRAIKQATAAPVAGHTR